MKKYLYLIFICLFWLSISDAKAQVDNRFRQPHSLNQFEVLVYASPDHFILHLGTCLHFFAIKIFPTIFMVVYTGLPLAWGFTRNKNDLMFLLK